MTLQCNTAGIALPTPTPISAPYWEGCRRGELRFQRCESCAAANFGPGVVCSSCRSTELWWDTSAGLGSLYSWTVVGRAPTPAFVTPYAPAIVRLDEGYDLVTAIVDCDASALQTGLRVMVRFVPVSEDITLPFFAPVSN